MLGFRNQTKMPQQCIDRRFCLQVLLGVKQTLMQLHICCLLITAAPVSLYHLLPHLPNLQPPRYDRPFMAQNQMIQEESNAM